MCNYRNKYALQNRKPTEGPLESELLASVSHACQLPFLANRNAKLAVPPLFWPVNCIKIGGHVALLSQRVETTKRCNFS